LEFGEGISPSKTISANAADLALCARQKKHVLSLAGGLARFFERCTKSDPETMHRLERTGGNALYAVLEATKETMPQLGEIRALIKAAGGMRDYLNDEIDRVGEEKDRLLDKGRMAPEEDSKLDSLNARLANVENAMKSLSCLEKIHPLAALLDAGDADGYAREVKKLLAGEDAKFFSANARFLTGEIQPQ